MVPAYEGLGSGFASISYEAVEGMVGLLGSLMDVEYPWLGTFWELESVA